MAGHQRGLHWQSQHLHAGPIQRHSASCTPTASHPRADPGISHRFPNPPLPPPSTAAPRLCASLSTQCGRLHAPRCTTRSPDRPQGPTSSRPSSCRSSYSKDSTSVRCRFMDLSCSCRASRWGEAGSVLVASARVACSGERATRAE